jgi:hypothetical protein
VRPPPSSVGSERVKGAHGRFISAYRDDELVWLLAQTRAITDPAPLTQARFDSLRGSVGHAGAPSAAQIARRLGLAWRDAVARAERSADALSRTLYARAATTTLGGDPRTRARWAVRVAALRLDTQRLSAADYDRVRATLISQAPPAQKPGLPTSAQLIKLAHGSWSDVQALAELRPRKRGRKPGLPLVDAIEQCLHAHGTLPTRLELYAFANANRISIARHERAYLDAIERLRARRARQGRWTPPRPPPAADRPDYTRTLQHGSGRRQGRQKWARDDCIQALCEFLAWLSANEPRATPTQSRYNAWSAKRPAQPWGKTIINHGGWNPLLAEARHRLMTGEPGAGGSDRPLERVLESSRKPHVELAIIDYARDHETFAIADIIRDLALSYAASDDRIRRLHSAGIFERAQPPASSDRRGHPLHHYRLPPLTEDLDRLRLLFARRRRSRPELRT